MAKPVSLKRRLMLGLLTAIALAWLATLLMSYYDTRRELEEVLDAHLAQSASLLVAQAGHELEEIDIEHLPNVHRYSRKVAFQIWIDGKLRLHSVNAPQQRLASNNVGFADTTIDGTAWRVFSQYEPRHDVLVQVAERRAVRDEFAQTIAEHLLLPLLITLPILGILIWFGVTGGLRPLQRLRDEVAARGSHDLAPLSSEGAPDEVLPLIESLNRLFERVRHSLEAERRFTADAAHELRTPLAAIRTQAQVAMTAQEAAQQQALHNVLQGCDRAAHAVEQMLTLARLDAEHLQAQLSPQNLRELTAAVIAEQAPQAMRKQISLELDAEQTQALHVHCDPGLLRILLRNLLDNAIRYSPAQSTISIAIQPNPREIILSICDQGPGIPQDSQTHLGERFYRVPGSTASGSGLGLSIVKRIAELHHAEISLLSTPHQAGLCASLHLPRSQP